MQKANIITFKKLLSILQKARDEQKNTTVSCGENLYVRILSNGQKSSFYYKDENGKLIRLGSTEELSLSLARAKARMKNPELAKKKLNIQGVTFEVYAEKWLETKKVLARICNHKTTYKYLQPLFDVPIKAINNRLVKDTLLNGSITPYKIKECICAICQILDLAVEDEIIESHNVNLLRKSPSIPKHVRGDGYLWQPLANFGELFKRIENLSEFNQRLYLIQSLTCLRTSELRRLRFSWIDWEQNIIIIPPEIMKVKRKEPFRIPMSIQLTKIIINMKNNSKSDLFFPRKDDTAILPRDVADPMKMVAQGYMHPHGFRKSLRTWCAENEVSSDVAAYCLDHHAIKTADDYYQKSDLLELRRPVMQKWADEVFKVIPESYKKFIN